MSQGAPPKKNPWVIVIVLTKVNKVNLLRVELIGWSLYRNAIMTNKS